MNKLSCYHNTIKHISNTISALSEGLESDLERDIYHIQFVKFADQNEVQLSVILRNFFKRQIKRLGDRVNERNYLNAIQLLDWDMEAKSLVQILRPYFTDGWRRGYLFAQRRLESERIGEACTGICTGWLSEAEDTPDELLAQTNAIAFIDRYIADLATQVNDVTAQRIKEVLDLVGEDIKTAIKKGEGVAPLMKAIEKRFTESGLAIAEYRALMIARTELIRALNAGARQVYVESGLLDKPESLWTATVRGKDGEEIKSYPVEYPPAHPNCRCAIALDVDARAMVWITSADERVCDICGPLDGQHAA